MNLAIEYFTRSFIFKDFFSTPCSLFLESFCKAKRIVVVFKDNSEQDHLIKVEHFALSDRSDTGLPKACSFEIEQALLFDNSKIIDKEFRPIVYQEEPVNSSFNYYNHPMEKDQYENYIFNFLNSSLHKSYKKDWLWDSFTSMYLGDKIVGNKMENFSFSKRRYIIEQEKKHVRNNRPNHWRLWKFWLSTMYFKEKIATELIFSLSPNDRQIS